MPSAAFWAGLTPSTPVCSGLAPLSSGSGSAVPLPLLNASTTGLGRTQGSGCSAHPQLVSGDQTRRGLPDAGKD